MILTAVGRHSDTAIPCKARNMINWIPVRAKPQARTKTPCRQQPVRKIFRLPARSAIEPARMRRQPIVNLKSRSDILHLTNLIVGDGTWSTYVYTEAGL